MTIADTPAGPSLDRLRPWPGLDAFSEALSPFFFGRETETEELFRRVRHDSVTLLFGRSGLGKTSLLQAGLFPRLRAAGLLPILVRLDFAPGASGLSAQVKAIMEHTFAEREVEATPITADESLWDWFHRSDRKLTGRDGRDLVPILVFDQFEEIFTLGLEREASRTASQGFLVELADLIENRPPESVKRALTEDPETIDRYLLDRDDYRIVIALREDYLAPLEGLRARAPSLGRNRYRLRRMNGRQALDAILNPGGGLIAPDLAGEIIRFIGRADPEDVFGGKEDDTAAGYEVEPAFLSLVCSELNELRIAAGQATISAELFAQSRETIIEGFYERALAGQPPAVRVLIEDQMLSESGFRESISVERARRALSEAGVPPSALDDLVRRRLLRIEERLDVARVEIIHDVLAPVIRRSRDTRHLRQAEADTEAREEELRRERRRVRRAYWIAAAMALLAVVNVALMVWAMHSTAEAERQRGIAEQQRTVADEQRAMAVKEKAFAEQQRGIAEQQTALAEQQRNIAQKQTAFAEEQRGIAERQKAFAEEQRGIAEKQQAFAEEQRGIAEEQRKRAEEAISLATRTANGLVFNLAQRFKNSAVPVAIIKDILERARELQEQLTASGQISPDLRRSQASALIEIGETLLRVGDSNGALAATRQAREILEALLVADPDNTDYQRVLSVDLEGLGNVLHEQGDLAGAIAEYRAMLKIDEQLAKNTPEDLQAQRDLMIDHERIGGVLRDQGDLDGALAEFRIYLGTAQRLAEREPNDPQRQRDYSIGHDMIGGVLRAQGDLDGALAEFRADLEIARRLAKQAPDNPQWQRDLSISHERIGDVMRERGDLDAALTEFRADLNLMEPLAAKDPDNEIWQRSVAIGHEKVGDVLRDRKDFTGALAEYRSAFKTFERLAIKDSGNAEWRIGLSVEYGRVGFALLGTDDAVGALAAFEKAEAIVTSLKGMHTLGETTAPGATWIDDRLEEARSKIAAAPDALKIARKLAEANPATAEQQRDAKLILIDIVDNGLTAGDAAGAVTAAEERVALARRVYAAAPTAENKTGLGGALGVLSWVLTLDKHPQQALDRADEALSLDPSLLFVQGNRAHALLLLGRFDEAKAVYVANKDKKFANDKTFAQVIAEDFAEMRKFQIDNPSMKRIEQLLAI